ncbi:hypothetical protein EJB05_29763 [Eragrostis curvula]|uniref:Non-structural maintenance of chromosomes element 1 homolog n=1 Tax=Eragrostis curvula TaxID=38414 RepID=A0A5J9UU65_9POAL|nr:hypothetical protein EJB05_29763 [Eragrostis curvula]
MAHLKWQRLVNNIADEESKLGTKYSVPHIAFYKGLASTCPNRGCNVRIHEYCLKKKFSQRKASRACPGCGTEWPWQEGEVDGDDEVNEPGKDEASANRSSRKRRKGVKAELVEENENAGPSTAAMPMRGSRKTKAEAVEAAQESSAAGASQPTGTLRRKK